MQWLVVASALAIVIFSVSVPVSATVYQVPVLAAFAIGILQCGSLPLSLVAPRWAVAGWALGAAGFVLFGVAAAGAPWPLDVCGLISLCVLLLSLGLRRPVIEGVVGWAVGIAIPLLVLFLVGAGATGNATVDGIVANLVTSTAITAFVLLAAVFFAQRARLRGDLAAEQQRRGIVEERNRIARELHDVVAHSMSVIQVQASSAPYRLPQLDDDARREFGEIAASARSAMQEMRQLLGVLRSDGADVDRMPQPGVAQIAELAHTLERAGTRVTVDLDDALPAEGLASTAAYRIAQESLSNVVRHAPGAPARVHAELVDGAIMLRVENDAPAAPAALQRAAGGHGIIGMRERCEMLGGTLHAGPTSAGGYLVRATLPVAASAPTLTTSRAAHSSAAHSSATHSKDPGRP